MKASAIRVSTGKGLAKTVLRLRHVPVVAIRNAIMECCIAYGVGLLTPSRTCLCVVPIGIGGAAKAVHRVRASTAIVASLKASRTKAACESF